MKLSIDTIVSIIAHLLAGTGIRKTAALCKISSTTVQRYELLVGQGCKRLLDRVLRGLIVHLLQLDEMHGFIHTRQSNLGVNSKPEHGDIWLYLGQDAVSRAIIHYDLGRRDSETTNNFIRELRARTIGKPQISTDGNSAYVPAIRLWFGTDTGYAQVVKKYASTRGSKNSRAPDKYEGYKRTPIFGNPDINECSTSYVERLNCTVRDRLAKFARRSVHHAKDLKHLHADLALFAANYNFVDVHGTLKTTPAAALGVVDGPSSLWDLVEAALSEPESASLPAIDPAVVRPRTNGLSLPRDRKARTSSLARALPLQERRVLSAVPQSGNVTISELAMKAFGELSPKKANSWTRNQLRGLVAKGFVEKVSRGTYRGVLQADELKCASVEYAAE